MGKLGTVPKSVWGFLDGWKLFLWSGVVALKAFFPDLPVWGMVDSGASAIGWDKLVPLIDPDALLQWGTLGIAMGHKVVKAYKEAKAGVPAAELLSPKV